MEKSKIEWTDRTYNPIKTKGGTFYCFKVSPACTHCYAERMSSRIAGMQHTTEQPYTNRLIYPEMELNREMLASWAKKGKPKRNFVSSMTDIFGEFVPDEFVFEILNAMYDAQKQTFQILTKRHERAYKLTIAWLAMTGIKKLPINMWIGFSIENQIYAELRLPYLVKIPATIRFISCEPLLSMLNIKPWIKKLHWVIAGGESGNRKTIRPTIAIYFQSLRDQCIRAQVAFFFKQWGEYIQYDQLPETERMQIKDGHFKFKSRNIEFKKKLYRVYRYGKHNTGALLDGKEYKQFPLLAN